MFITKMEFQLSWLIKICVVNRLYKNSLKIKIRIREIQIFKAFTLIYCSYICFKNVLLLQAWSFALLNYFCCFMAAVKGKIIFFFVKIKNDVPLICFVKKFIKSMIKIRLKIFILKKRVLPKNSPCA